MAIGNLDHHAIWIQSSTDKGVAPLLLSPFWKWVGGKGKLSVIIQVILDEYKHVFGEIHILRLNSVLTFLSSRVTTLMVWSSQTKEAEVAKITAFMWAHKFGHSFLGK